MTVAGRGASLFSLPADGRRPEPGWQHRCTRDPEAIGRMLATGANLGTGCRASGVVVLDLDRHKDQADGVARFATELAAREQAWPDTLTTRTPNRGLHLYFQVPAGATVGSASGVRSPLGEGIDVRGPGRRSGGYVLAPGSVLAGRPYLIEHDAPIAELPAWLAALLATPSRPVPARSKLSPRWRTPIPHVSHTPQWDCHEKSHG
ncbi:MAG: bifunctional DNA primase/polymerase [Acidimicrobiales bacterium]|nr:bifunctional DNA primase/polymerase [Acidimicrobiales bacterium]